MNEYEQIRNNPDIEYQVCYHCLHPGGASLLTDSNRALILRLAFNLDQIDVTGKLTPDWETVKAAPRPIIRRLAQFCLQVRAKEEDMRLMRKNPNISRNLRRALKVVS